MNDSELKPILRALVKHSLALSQRLDITDKILGEYLPGLPEHLRASLRNETDESKATNGEIQNFLTLLDSIH